MIKKAAKLSVLALCGGLVVGCASTGDIATLQTQVDDIKVQVAAAEASAASAAEASSAAAKSAAAAEAAANETSSKLDRMFKKSMSK
jgi:outer membrane murein-binding lipoprotein Lpp